MSTATGKASHPPSGLSGSGVTLPASRATKSVSALHDTSDKGQLVGSFLTRNAKITAGLAPLRSMRGESPAVMAVLGKKVSQFMKQGLLDLGLGNIAQGGVQPDLPSRGNGYSGSCPHPGIPADGHQRGECRGKGKQHRSRSFLKGCVALALIVQSASFDVARRGKIQGVDCPLPDRMTKDQLQLPQE